MTWRDTHEVEQMGLDIPDPPARTYKPWHEIKFKSRVVPCNCLAPEHITVCGRMFPSGIFCQRIKDHPGGHSAKPSTCNRPLGHEGPHAVVVMRDARRLGEWA